MDSAVEASQEEDVKIQLSGHTHSNDKKKPGLPKDLKIMVFRVFRDHHRKALRKCILQKKNS